MKKTLLLALSASFILSLPSNAKADEAVNLDEDIKIEESIEEVSLTEAKEISTYAGQTDTKTEVSTDINVHESENSEVNEESDVVINEVDTEQDYVELYNNADERKDISGWYIKDDKEDREIERIKEGTFIESKNFHTLENGKDFSFGLGKNDQVVLYDKDGNIRDKFSWDSHPFGSYGRYPDGVGEFVDGEVSKNAPNNKEDDTEIKEADSSIKINEIESSDPNDGPDYVEIYNDSDEDKDISGYFILDDNLTREHEVLPDGSVIKAKGFFVFENGIHFSFGLGKNDQVNLFNKDKELIDSFAWDGHAEGVLARGEDGKGDFVDSEASKGYSNNIDEEKMKDEKPVVINEVESSAEGGGKDYAEIYNISDNPVDISGWYILDNDPDHEKSPLKEGTIIEPLGFFVFEEGVDFDFGLGSNDEVNLYDKDGNLVDKFAWTSHAPGTYGRLKDGFGQFTDTNPSKGRKNTAFTPKTIDIETANFPGNGDIKILDNETVFDLTDLSGIDQDGEWIYGVNNKERRFLIFKLENGEIKLAPGFTNKGKSVAFIKDKDNPEAEGPDSEGITVDKDGFIYLAVERDNGDKNVNKNMILQVQNPFDKKDKFVADKEWDITNILPDVEANLGIETIEWVGFDHINKRLFDQSLNKTFDKNDYKNAYQDGVFFVGLEANGNIYALILQDDGSAKVINELSTNLGGVMGLDYDRENDILWALADDGFDNIHTAIQFDGTDKPKVINVSAPSEMNKRLNNEGFVILPSSEKDTRDVLYFMDGTNKEAIRLASLNKAYMSDLGLEKIDIADEKEENPIYENSSEEPKDDKNKTEESKDEKSKIDPDSDSKKDDKKESDSKNKKEEKESPTASRKQSAKKIKKSSSTSDNKAPKTGVTSLSSIILTGLGSILGLGLLKKRK
ncbi:lamin tail domain-containing protein [Anaerococcus sp. AGMB00486]|uniref:Lamin tail domain-containing protein n=1 Tax=Anaerococcus faecalis TaxID=2742993 RepID=A0ABX2NC51_9FIRM|nr:lamin tail domain-containing protein [Anaerococcus faecalis]NVF12294.1 lamin tail domain-containing protein [Anaerococcus faecalis]